MDKKIKTQIKTFMKLLDSEMKKRNWNDYNLAEEIEVSPMAVNNWRKGRHGMRVEHFFKALEVFGLSVKYIDEKSKELAEVKAVN